MGKQSGVFRRRENVRRHRRGRRCRRHQLQGRARALSRTDRPSRHHPRAVSGARPVRAHRRPAQGQRRGGGRAAAALLRTGGRQAEQKNPARTRPAPRPSRRSALFRCALTALSRKSNGRRRGPIWRIIWAPSPVARIAMQDFHHNRARALLENAEELFDKAAVDAAVTRMAGTLNARFDAPGSEQFPLVLGVMGGAVVFTGNLLPQLRFPLEFDYIHVSRYGDDDQGGQVVWKVVPRSNVAGRVVIVFDDKAIGKPKPCRADIVGITIPNRFVVGFGMDAYGYWRNLPGLWAIRNEA